MNKTKSIILTPRELESLFNLADGLHDMLVRDYFYTFDLKEAGRLIDKLYGSLLKKQGRKPDTKKWKQKWIQQLKQDWKDYACSNCGYLIPNNYYQEEDEND